MGIGAWGLHFGIEKSWVRYYPTYDQARNAIFSDEVCADMGIIPEDIKSIDEISRQGGKLRNLSINIRGDSYLPLIIAYHQDIELMAPNSPVKL